MKFSSTTKYLLIATQILLGMATGCLGRSNRASEQEDSPQLRQSLPAGHSTQPSDAEREKAQKEAKRLRQAKLLVG